MFRLALLHRPLKLPSLQYAQLRPHLRLLQFMQLQLRRQRRRLDALFRSLVLRRPSLRLRRRRQSLLVRPQLLLSPSLLLAPSRRSRQLQY